MRTILKLWIKGTPLGVVLAFELKPRLYRLIMRDRYDEKYSHTNHMYSYCCIIMGFLLFFWQIYNFYISNYSFYFCSGKASQK